MGDGPQYDLAGPFTALFTGWEPLRCRSNPTSQENPEFDTFNTWEQMRRHGGIEIALLDIVFLRWGTQYEHPLLGTRDFASRGWGIDLYYVAFERATVAGDPGPFRGFASSTITVRVPLQHRADNFWIPLLRKFA